MDERLAPGTKLVSDAGLAIVVDTFLGGGGQGDVYRVDTPDGVRALKYYHPHTSSAAQHENLRQLASIGFDDPRFMWPLDTVSGPSGRRYGYIMDLRPDGWATIPDLLARRAAGTTLRSLYRIGVHLASGYRALHAQGMAYRDINWGNVFFHPPDGQILICDNDNALFGNAEAAVRGTSKFMAPEVFRNEASPSAQTDLHSLAVLLFMIFVNGHPLDGALEAAEMCLDDEAEARLYGTSPVFIYDPADKSNRPQPGIHDAVIALWPTLPSELQQLFSRSFTEGLHTPSKRVTEGEWAKVLTRMHDRIFRCADCGKHNVFDKKLFEQTGVAGSCWSCQRPLIKPPMLTADNHELVLEPDARIFSHHIRAVAEPTFDEPIAELVAHPAKPGRYGLRNVGSASWTKLAPDGSTVGVEPGQTARISSDLVLEINGIRFEIG